MNIQKKNNNNNHGKDFHMINLLCFSIVQFCYSNLMYLRWVNLIY